MKKKYTTNLSPIEWQFISKYFHSRRKPKWEYKILVEGMLYITKNGCNWRDLPLCFPPWQTVYWYFRKWSKEGIIDLIISDLQVIVRLHAGRKASPGALVIDSQSVKNTSFSTKHVGFDGGKKIKGRKRHIITDTMGNLVAVKVHSANLHDSKSAKMVLATIYKNKADFPRLTILFADKGYRGKLANWIKKYLNIRLEVVRTYTKLANNGKMMVSLKDGLSNALSLGGVPTRLTIIDV